MYADEASPCGSPLELAGAWLTESILGDCPAIDWFTSNNIFITASLSMLPTACQ